jgi:hypothetical protein
MGRSRGPRHPAAVRRGGADKEVHIPAGRPSRLTRWVGLALARRSIRSYVATTGPEGFAALAATLSLPAVEVLVRGEHLVVRENGELLASGRPPAAAPPERL